MNCYKPELDKCKNGHYRTDATIYIHPKTGVRSCKLCRQNGKKRGRELERQTDRRIVERLQTI